MVGAGLIPALRHGRIPVSERWKHVLIRPGSNPALALLSGFAHTSGMSQYEETEHDALKRLQAMIGDDHYLLVVDQFEELLVRRDVPEFTEFARLLHDLLGFFKRVATVLVVRSDYFEALMVSRILSDLVENTYLNVPPLSQFELRAVIEEPARAVGVALEPGLPELIIKDFGDTPGGLPLLQYAMARLWDLRRSGYLTVDAYNRIGGARTAIARSADEHLSQLPPNGREMAFSILMRLIYATPDGQFVRRTARLSELVLANELVERTRAILDTLVAARLVVSNVDIGTDSHEALYELAHETLMREWPPLRERLERERVWLTERSRLDAEAQQWERASYSPDYLYQGAALARVLQLMPSSGTLNDLTQQFIDAGCAAEGERLRRQVRRRRIIVGSIAASIVLLMTFSAASWYLRQQAVLAREIAQMQSRLAEAQKAAAEAARLSNQLANLSASSVVSRSGRLLLTTDLAGVGRLWDQVTGQPIGMISGEKGAISSAAFSPDGTRVATGTENGQISIWQTASLDLPAMILGGPRGPVRVLAFSPDGRQLASGGDDRTARLWSVADGARVADIRATLGSTVGLAFSPDGSRLTVSSADGSQAIVDPRTGRVIQQIAPVTGR